MNMTGFKNKVVSAFQEVLGKIPLITEECCDNRDGTPVQGLLLGYTFRVYPQPAPRPAITGTVMADELAIDIFRVHNDPNIPNENEIIEYKNPAGETTFSFFDCIEELLHLTIRMRFDAWRVFHG